jgi:ribosomal protein L13
MPRGREAQSLSEGPQWVVVDAAGQVLGRLATVVARVLIGKDKPNFTPYLDCGDHVVVINAQKIRLTGNKLEAKIYRHHSGFPGGLKESSGQAHSSQPRGLDDSRGGPGHAAEEQTARQPREKAAHLSGR